MLNDGKNLIGFDAETFLSDLQDGTVIQVCYPDGRRCRAEMASVTEAGVRDAWAQGALPMSPVPSRPAVSGHRPSDVGAGRAGAGATLHLIGQHHRAGPG